MKKLNYLLALIAVIAMVGVSSCRKHHGNSPVDQYVEILDAAIEKTEKINSFEDLTDVQQIINPQEALEIVQKNAGYELTDNDKEKLKKSFDKLLKVAYNKTIEYGGVPESMKEATKAQVDLIIDAANKGIDNAKTLGELNGIR